MTELLLLQRGRAHVARGNANADSRTLAAGTRAELAAFTLAERIIIEVIIVTFTFMFSLNTKLMALLWPSEQSMKCALSYGASYQHVT